MKWTDQYPKVSADCKCHRFGQESWLQCQKIGGTRVLPHAN